MDESYEKETGILMVITAQKRSRKTGFKFFCGAEVRFDGTINDYLVYGLDGAWLTYEENLL